MNPVPRIDFSEHLPNAMTRQGNHEDEFVSKEDTLPMGFSFMLPADMTDEQRNAIKESYLMNGGEGIASPTRVRLNKDMITLQRELHESGNAILPCEVPEFGRLLSSTATLMERPLPYFLNLEQVRGKLHQVRNQLAEWESAGLARSPQLDWDLRQATRAFAQAMSDPMAADADVHCRNAIALGFQAADVLIEEYTHQILALRHSRQPRLDTQLGCWLHEKPVFDQMETLGLAFNTLRLPLRWRDIEPTEANYFWDSLDERVRWATERGFQISVGPIVDFTPEFFPEWLETWNGDLTALGSFISDFVETAVSRYRGKVKQWLLCTRSNCATCLDIGEEDQIRLTARLLDSASQLDPEAKFTIGISHPWGSYLGRPGFTYAPFVFADTLLRAGLPVAGLEIEWLMGSTPRGDFVHDRLESSKVLDIFGMLGVPVSVTLGYPSSAEPDEMAGPGERVAKAGFWRGFSPETQADWCARFTKLAISKPFVSGVFWDCWTDAVPHRIPNSGLIDANGGTKPAFGRLEEIRVQHLK